MLGSATSSARRTAIRENRPDCTAAWWNKQKENGTVASIGIAAVFCLLAFAILSLRQEVLPFRPGQAVPNDIISRVEFSFKDKGILAERQKEARDHTPR